MNELKTPEEVYHQHIIECRSTLGILQKKRSQFGWARLSMIIFPIALIYLFIPGQLLFFLAGMVVTITVFLWIVIKDINNDQLISYNQNLLALNEEELEIMNGRYEQRESGKRWEVKEHDYAADLDIFGNFSLFQYYHRCSSEQGMQLLAQRFQYAMEQHQIAASHEAVREMSGRVKWRQKWQAIGRAEQFTIDTEKRINDWLSLQGTETASPFWKALLYIFPVISIGTLLSFILGFIPFSLFIFLMIAFFYFSGIKVKQVNASHQYLSRILPQVDVLYKQLHHFEDEKWTAELTGKLYSTITKKEQSAGREFFHLKKLLNRFDMRLNLVVNPILNIFLLWDIRQLIDLWEWKKKNKENVFHWMQTMTEIDVLNSISTFSYNHLNYVYPEVSTDYFQFNAKDLGHPLIAESKRVVNDAVINGVGQIMLITGSNMAGKSTFLRSVGINTVLAMAGSPVCATIFSISQVQVISSMRIADNLAENTSTFYAELKKLKTIIDKVNRKERLLILMDEILRGTNSFDRHAGSEALLEQMIQQDAVALVATHDVELGALAKKYPSSIHNHHFDVQVKGEELYFDFKLKEGICQSMNASILMKKIGIHMH